MKKKGLFYDIDGFLWVADIGNRRILRLYANNGTSALSSSIIPNDATLADNYNQGGPQPTDPLIKTSTTEFFTQDPVTKYIYVHFSNRLQNIYMIINPTTTTPSV